MTVTKEQKTTALKGEKAKGTSKKKKNADFKSAFLML